MDLTEVATGLLEAFNDGDLDRMRALMDPQLVAWVSDAGGEAQPLTGADAYLDRVTAMDLAAVSYRVTPTQAPVRVTEWRMADAKPEESDRFWA